MSFDGNFDDQIMNGLFWWKNGSLYLSFGATRDFTAGMVVAFLTRDFVFLPKRNVKILFSHSKIGLKYVH
jgi:hypothetical protein